MRRAFSRLFDNGAHVSSSGIRVTLSNIPYLPFKNLQLIGVVLYFRGGGGGVPDSGAVF